VLGGGVSFPTGGTALSPEFFLDFGGQNGVFSWTLGAKFCFYDQNSTKIHQEYKDCHGDRLACDKEHYSGCLSL